MSSGARRRSAPAALRNRDAILKVLRARLPESDADERALLFEVASGTGEHALHFARALPHVDVQPSDVSPEALASIEAWRAEAGLPNLLPACRLDVCEPADDPGEHWAARLRAVFCANMIHIAPWSAALGLLGFASSRLRPDDPLVLYGPYRRGGRHTAPSNARFDASLRERDPRWGVRDLEQLQSAAAALGLALEEVVEMPANNLMPVFRRQPRGAQVR